MRLVAIFTSSALVMGLSTAGPVTAPARAGEPAIDARDRSNDVRIYRQVSGVPYVERRGIDIRRATITQQGKRWRFEVRVKKLWFARTYDQMAFIHLTQVDGPWTSEIAMSPQHPTRAYAVRYDQESFDYVHCDAVRSRADRVRARIWLRIPSRCLPTGPVRVRVITLTGTFRGDGSPWSRDDLVVRGRHELR